MEDNGHGFFHWNELLTHDVEKAKAFFASTLGWTYEDMPLPDGGTYYVAIMNDEPVGGMMKMPAEVPAGTPSHWLGYIEVDDLDARLEKVSRAGGSVLRSPFEVSEVGRIAVVADPSGAVIGFITPSHFQDD